MGKHIRALDAALAGLGKSAAPVRGTGLPAGLTDDRIHVKYAQKIINANVNAMVHLHLGTMLLDYLVDRKIVNYGENTKATDIAQSIIRANRGFIDRMTRAHQANMPLPHEEFVGEIQPLVKSLIDKLSVMLMTGDRKLGAPESELAQPIPYPLKVATAIVIDDLAKLFELDNRIQQKCDEYIIHEKDLEDNEIFQDFLAHLKAALWTGNGTKSFAYMRLAAASMISLSRTGEGVDMIHERVKASIEDTGTLENTDIELADVPDFEEDFENLNALFPDVDITLRKHGGAVASVASAIFQYVFAHLDLADDVLRGIGEHMVDYAKGRSQFAALPNELEEKAREGFLLDFRILMSGTIQGFIDGSDRKTVEERAREVRQELRFVSNVLTIVASDRIVNKGRVVMHMGQVTNDTSTTINDDFYAEIQAAIEDVESQLDISEEALETAADYEKADRKLDEYQQTLVKAFLGKTASLMQGLAEGGTVTLSDRDTPPTDSRVPYFRDTMIAVTELRKGVSENLIGDAKELATKGGEESPLHQQFDLASRLLMFLNNKTFHAVKTSN